MNTFTATFLDAINLIDKGVMPSHKSEGKIFLTPERATILLKNRYNRPINPGNLDLIEEEFQEGDNGSGAPFFITNTVEGAKFTDGQHRAELVASGRIPAYYVDMKTGLPVTSLSTQGSGRKQSLVDRLSRYLNAPTKKNGTIVTYKRLVAVLNAQGTAILNRPNPFRIPQHYTEYLDLVDNFNEARDMTSEPAPEGFPRKSDYYSVEVEAAVWLAFAINSETVTAFWQELHYGSPATGSPVEEARKVITIDKGIPRKLGCQKKRASKVLLLLSYIVQFIADIEKVESYKINRNALGCAMEANGLTVEKGRIIAAGAWGN